MDLLTQGQERVFEQFLKEQARVLDLIAIEIEEFPVDSTVLKQFENVLEYEGGSATLLFLQNGVCTASSKKELVGKDFTSVLAHRARLAQGHDLFTSMQFFSQDEALVLGKALPEGYLMIAFPFDQLLEAQAIVNEDQYPINFAVLNPDQAVVASTDGLLDKQSFGGGRDYFNASFLRQEICF